MINPSLLDLSDKIVWLTIKKKKMQISRFVPYMHSLQTPDRWRR